MVITVLCHLPVISVGQGVPKLVCGGELELCWRLTSLPGLKLPLQSLVKYNDPATHIPYLCVFQHHQC